MKKETSALEGAGPLKQGSGKRDSVTGCDGLCDGCLSQFGPPPYNNNIIIIIS